MFMYLLVNLQGLICLLGEPNYRTSLIFFKGRVSVDHIEGAIISMIFF